MALVVGRDQLSFEQTGVHASVPSNDVARLMYYLKCVCTVIDCDDDPAICRFTNYNNWSSLSYEEQKVLLVLCYKFSPDEFEDKVFFNSDELCGDSSNEFYKINQIRHRMIAADSIIIAGRECSVTNIMTYKMSWMHQNYIGPMQRMVQHMNRPTIPTIVNNYSQPQVIYVQQRPVPVADTDCCCTIL